MPAGIVETVKVLKLSLLFHEDAKRDMCVSDENGNPLTPSDNMVAGAFKVTTVWTEPNIVIKWF